MHYPIQCRGLDPPCRVRLVIASVCPSTAVGETGSMETTPARVSTEISVLATNVASHSPPGRWTKGKNGT